MKTYILDSLNRLKTYSNTLDAKAALCNKAWVVFNSDGNKEVWKFKHDGTVSIAIDGEFQIYKWKYDSCDNSINIMKSQTTGICIKPIIYNEFFLGFRQDGTDKDMAMIEESMIAKLSIKSAQALAEMEHQLLLEAYSQTAEGRAEHAEELAKMNEERERMKREEEELKKAEEERLDGLFKETTENFFAELRDDDRKLSQFLNLEFKDYLLSNKILLILGVLLIIDLFVILCFDITSIWKGVVGGMLITILVLLEISFLVIESHYRNKRTKIYKLLLPKYEDFLSKLDLPKSDKDCLKSYFATKE